MITLRSHLLITEWLNEPIELSQCFSTFWSRPQLKSGPTLLGRQNQYFCTSSNYCLFCLGGHRLDLFRTPENFKPCSLFLIGTSTFDYNKKLIAVTLITLSNNVVVPMMDSNGVKKFMVLSISYELRLKSKQSNEQ